MVQEVLNNDDFLQVSSARILVNIAEIVGAVDWKLYRQKIWVFMFIYMFVLQNKFNVSWVDFINEVTINKLTMLFLQNSSDAALYSVSLPPSLICD
jgi:hypothetical protein